jgi:hypothetical protein
MELGYVELKSSCGALKVGPEGCEEFWDDAGRSTASHPCVATIMHHLHRHKDLGEGTATSQPLHDKALKIWAGVLNEFPVTEYAEWMNWIWHPTRS